MATLQKYKKLSVRERQNRYFSKDFKRKKVSEIERNIRCNRQKGVCF